MSKESSAGSSAVSLATLLTVAFVVLKLCKVIDWSWWWVLSPIWIQLSIVLLVAICYIVYLVIQEYRSIRRKRD